MIEVTEKEFKEDLTKYTKYIATDITKFQNPCDI